VLGFALIGIAIGAGVFYAVRSYRAPSGGKAENVAPAPAGGRTQAQPADTALAADPHGAHGDSSRAAPPIQALGDPLLPGIPETPDVPPDQLHKGLKKIGERIVDAVEKDGTVGDHEVPGVDLTRPRNRSAAGSSPTR
jgi:hypothetical protein